jgi:predicted transcriptional regulator
MNLKKIILEIIKDNPGIGRAKFDRIYYSKVSYENNWVPIVKELRKDELIKEDELKITDKALKFLDKINEL